MAKKIDGTVPVVTQPQSVKLTPSTPQNRQVEYIVSDGKIVADTSSGVLQ